MSLSKRNKFPRLNDGGAFLSHPGVPMEKIVESDPDSPHYVPKYCGTAHQIARKLVNFMIAQQAKKFGDTLSLSEKSGQQINRITPALLKQMKALLEIYTPEQIEQGIKQACSRSEWQFSVKFVKKILEEQHTNDLRS